MNNHTEDYKALSALVQSEKNRLSEKRTLLDRLEREIAKSEDALDPALAASLVDSLYRTEGMAPPLITEREADECIAGLRRRKGNPGKRRIRRTLFAGSFRWAAAACFIVFFAFSVNYVTALISGACLVSRIEPRFCCETKYCPCRVAVKTPQ
ncbi:MAG: hypothetical protein LBQ57_04970 [Spirochaetales bacterium]|nr:hypothetical protein [Spirochaetales bacterium]